jgi:hypothetical protein
LATGERGASASRRAAAFTDSSIAVSFISVRAAEKCLRRSAQGEAASPPGVNV